MYQFPKLKEKVEHKPVLQKRGDRTCRPFRENKTNDTGGLFDDTLHQRLMQSPASDKRNTNPYLCRNASDDHTVQLKNVVQMANGDNAYDAGAGGDWHIHYGQHIKYDGMNETRVNFHGRSRKQIRRELGAIIDRYAVLQNTVRGQNFRACINWINDHF